MNKENNELSKNNDESRIVNKSMDNDFDKFKNEYESLNGKIDEKKNKKYLDLNVDTDVKIKYSSINEILELLKTGTGVIYFGFETCPWCRNVVPLLLQSLNDSKIDTLHYFNDKDIRDEKVIENGQIITKKAGTKEYEELINILNDKLPIYKELEDIKIKRLYFPTIVVVKDGKVESLHSGTLESHKDPYISLDENQKLELKNIYLNMFRVISENEMCDEETTGC